MLVVKVRPGRTIYVLPAEIVSQGICTKRPGGIYGTGCRRPIFWARLRQTGRMLPVERRPDADGVYPGHLCPPKEGKTAEKE